MKTLMSALLPALIATAPAAAAAAAAAAFAIAYVSNRTTYGFGLGRTEAAAEEMALDTCPSCKLVLSECE